MGRSSCKGHFNKHWVPFWLGLICIFINETWLVLRLRRRSFPEARHLLLSSLRGCPFKSRVRFRSHNSSSLEIGCFLSSLSLFLGLWVLKRHVEHFLASTVKFQSPATAPYLALQESIDLPLSECLLLLGWRSSPAVEAAGEACIFPKPQDLPCSTPRRGTPSRSPSFDPLSVPHLIWAASARYQGMQYSVLSVPACWGGVSNSTRENPRRLAGTDSKTYPICLAYASCILTGSLVWGSSKANANKNKKH